MDFHHYHRTQQLLALVKSHTPSSVKTLQTRIVQWNDATENEIQPDLDFIHSILKHARACPASFSSACAAQILYPQLAQLIIHLTNDTTLSYSLLICIVDLVKNDALFPLSESQTLDFISIACPLWSNHKIYNCRKSMELCCRLLSRPLNDSSTGVIVQRAVSYIRQCQVDMTRADVDLIRSSEYTEFYFNSKDTMALVYDRTTMRWMIHITFALLLHQPGSHASLIKEIKDVYNRNHMHNSKEFLFDICCANDDDTVQLLDTILSIYQQPHPQNANFLSSIHLDPHTVFIYFVQKCGNTHDILVDLLLENDSEFIPYFHRYIIYATQDIEAFKKAMRDLPGTDLDTMQTIVANILLVLEGDGFPYNAAPLIRRLTIFEEKLFEN